MINAAVLGAGSWGTALAIQLANNGHQVRAWDHDEELISALNAENENKRYLPGNKFPTKLTAEHNLTTAINHADFILSVVPSYAMRVVCEQLAALQHTNKFIWASKGFEKQTKMMMHQVVEDLSLIHI